ncbi:MAG TPA: hypothetical protein VF988_07755 [Verrucomicrobiae bacterium]
MSRLRSLDSKISFFAFADIITAVSGVLIFVALLLATDLGIPTDSHSSAPQREQEQEIQDVLAQQVEIDADNQRLQELLTIANTAPDAAKLKADLQRLNAQLAEERKKQTALSAQMSDSETAMAKRDADLGLAGLKAQIEKEKQETAKIAAQENQVKSEVAALDRNVAGLESKLLQLRQREGKLWLIPEKGVAGKEPILATVSGSGIKIERFDHPDLTKQLNRSTARWDFGKYLEGVKSANEYVVFLVRPSGIGMFQDVVKATRDKGIEVGYDALEEDKDVYFATPPVLDETVPVASTAGYISGSGGYSEPGGGGGTFTGTSGRSGNGGGHPGSTSGAGSTQAGSATVARNGSSSGGTGSTSSGADAAGNGTEGTSSGAGGTGNSTAATTGTGGGKSNEQGKGNGSGSATNSATVGGAANGAATNATASTTSPKAEPKNTKSPAAKPPPPPVVKSWWQRFLEWLASFF